MIKKNKPKTNAPDSGISIIQILPFIITALLLLIGSLIPVYATWGFNIWGGHSPSFTLPLLLFSIILILSAAFKPIAIFYKNITQKLISIIERIPNLLSFTIISIGMLCIFLLFRSQAMVYGDGYLILQYLSQDVTADITGKNLLQFSSIMINRLLISGLTGMFDITNDFALAIVNSIGGLVGFWGLYCIAGKLAEDKATKYLIFFSALTSGATLLFFGYIENYTWLLSLSLWTFYFALGYMHDNNGILPMLLSCLLTILWHAIAAYLIIIVILAVLLKKSKQENKLFNIPNNYLMLIAGAVLFIFILIIQASNLLQIFVPIWPIAGNNYWFLSPGHIIDMINLLLMIAPLGIIFIITSLFDKRSKIETKEKTATLLSWFAFLTFMIVFWVDPELGAPRDWDLLAIAGFPVSLWGAYRFTKLSISTNKNLFLIVPVIIVMLLHLSPHIYEKHDSNLAVKRLDNLLWNSPHYQTDYDKGFRCLSWGMTLGKLLNEYEISKKYFYRSLEADPTYASAYFNLGQTYNFQHKTDSSEYFFEQAARLEPDNKIYMLKLADAKQKQKKFDEALHCLDICARLDPNNPSIFTTKGMILYGLGDIVNAVEQFHVAYRINPNGFEENYNLGSLNYATKLFEEAYPLLIKANQIDPNYNDAYEYLIPVMLALGKDTEAAKTLQRYKSINPNAKTIEFYRQQIPK